MFGSVNEYLVNVLNVFIVVVESHEVHGEGFKMTNIGEAEN